MAVIAAALTQRPLLISLVTAMTYLPWLIFGIPAGVFVDRFDKRRVFYAADFMRCGMAIAAACLAVFGLLSIYYLIVVVFTITALQTISDSCFNSLLPDVVEERELAVANARLSAGQSGAGLLGNAIGGLAASIGFAVPFAMNAATFGAGAILVSKLPRGTAFSRNPASGSRKGLDILREMIDGAKTIQANRRLRAYMYTASFSNVCNGLNSAMLPLLTLDVIHLKPAEYGFLTATTALMMIIGNLTASKFPTSLVNRRGSLFALFLKIPGFFLVFHAGQTWEIALALAILGFSSGLWNVQSSSMLMKEAPPEFRGRVVSTYRTSSMTGTPLGAALAGVIGSMFGIRSALLCAFLGAVALSMTFAVLSREPAPAVRSGTGEEDIPDLAEVKGSQSGRLREHGA